MVALEQRIRGERGIAPMAPSLHSAIPDGQRPEGIVWSVNPTRRVSQTVADAQVDALCAQWRVRNPGW